MQPTNPPMPDDLLTVPEMSLLSGLSPYSLRNYISRPNREPRLKVDEVRTVNNVNWNLVRRDHFEAWLRDYRAKKPFGAQLHKDWKVR